MAVDGNNVYGKIPNAQIEFDFLTEIEKKGNVTYEVSRNLAGDDIIISKTAEPNEGDNKYYILVYQNGDLLSRYNVTIRRREIYDVTFNTDGGTAVEPQQIEEDNFVTEPTTIKAGYTFIEWNYIFDNPITENTVITASWAANSATKYKAEYYLQNLADDNYTLDFTDNLTGETDTQASAVVKTYNHFTYNANKSITSGNINGDGTTVLRVYYTREVYEFTVTNDNTKGGAIDCTDNGSYRFEKQINLSATVNDGYDFVGWFSDDTQVSSELKYLFTLTEKIDIKAKYLAHNDTKYTVETYFENLDGTYTKQSTEEKFGETDTAAIITYVPEHYTVNESKSVLSGNINGDGSLMLTIYYARELYKVSVTADMGITSDTVKGDYKYGSIIDDITATLNLGYNWQGWYSDNEFMTNGFIISSFIVDKNINYIAKTTTKYEMLAFNFMSTPMTCEITGIKDNTVNGIVIPDYVTSIGNCAFTHCGNLSSVIIGCGVTSIGYEAFWYCYGLTSIVIPNSIFSIGDRAFFGCEKLVEIINKSDLDIQKSSSDYGYIGYYALTVHNEESRIVNKDGYLFIADSENNYLLGFIGTEIALTLPSDYNGQNYQIYKYAFYNCTNLTSVTIPDGITIIEDYAFYNCSGLTSITLPTSLVKIKSYSFENCSHLTSVFYDGDIAGWCNISFNNSYANPLFYANSLFIKGNDGYKLVDNLVIPEVVTKIGSYSFINCTSLTQIFIPKSVTSIGDNAFYKCSPKKVYYMGTAAEWKNIEIGKSNNLFPRYYYSETEQEGCWHYVDGEIVEWPIYGY